MAFGGRFFSGCLGGMGMSRKRVKEGWNRHDLWLEDEGGWIELLFLVFGGRASALKDVMYRLYSQIVSNLHFVMRMQSQAGNYGDQECHLLGFEM